MSDKLTDHVRVLKERADALLASRVLGDGSNGDQLLARAISVSAAADDLMRAAVQQSRDDGATWQAVGDALGVSRQAAFQRYGRPIDPRSGAPMNTVPLPNAGALAVSVVRDLESGRWPEIVGRFDEPMTARLSEEALAAAWSQIIGLSGALEECGEPVVTRAGDLTITDTSLAMEAGDYTARIAFRDDRTIAGLHILDGEKAAPA